MPSCDDYNWNKQFFKGEYSTKAFWSDTSNGHFTFELATETNTSGTNNNTNAADAANDGIVHVTLDRTHSNWELLESEEIITD